MSVKALFQSWKFLTDFSRYFQFYKYISLYRLILVKHLYEWKNAEQYLTNINQYIVILTDTYQY